MVRPRWPPPVRVAVHARTRASPFAAQEYPATSASLTGAAPDRIDHGDTLPDAKGAAAAMVRLVPDSDASSSSGSDDDAMPLPPPAVPKPHEAGAAGVAPVAAYHPVQHALPPATWLVPLPSGGSAAAEPQGSGPPPPPPPPPASEQPQQEQQLQREQELSDFQRRMMELVEKRKEEAEKKQQQQQVSTASGGGV